MSDQAASNLKSQYRARKRGFLRSIVAGLAAHYVALLAMFTIAYIARPFVWAAIYGVPYSPPKGQLDQNTNEWLMIQFINFLSWVAAGIGTSHWAPTKSLLAPTVLGGLAVTLLFMVPLPETNALRIAIWLLSAPMGIFIGYQLYSRKFKNGGAVSDVT